MTTSAGKDAEKTEHSFVAGGTVKQCGYRACPAIGEEQIWVERPQAIGGRHPSITREAKSQTSFWFTVLLKISLVCCGK